MNKKEYESPKLEVIVLEKEDVLTVSSKNETLGWGDSFKNETF